MLQVLLLWPTFFLLGLYRLSRRRRAECKETRGTEGDHSGS